MTVENAYRTNKETIKTYSVSKEFIDMTMIGDGFLPESGYLRGCRLITHYVNKYSDFLLIYITTIILLLKLTSKTS